MRKPALAASLVLAWVVACTLGPSSSSEPLGPVGLGGSALLDPSALAVVDCLIPPKIRRIGKYTKYLSARQALRLRVIDCQNRGGEYTEPGQATVKTALDVWLPDAEEGKAEAQRQVGEIYERGIGGTKPDYKEAFRWYKKAAEQGLVTAQFNLANLYKLGLGVPRDLDEARRWFDMAAGPELAALRAEIRDEAPPAEPIEIIDPPTRAAQRGVTIAAGPPDEFPRVVIGKVNVPGGIRSLAVNGKKVEPDQRGIFKTSLSFHSGMQLRVVATDKHNAEIERTFELLTEAALPPEQVIDFGRYYALVIGNDAYEELPDLRTARADAQAVAKILEDRYGFEVQTLLDGTRRQIYNAIDGYVPKLTRKDNLLIYYAGHGGYDRTNERGFWLPVDAGPGNPSGAFSTTDITDALNRMNAKHVLVIADSCYSGAVLRDAGSFQKRAGLDAEQRREFLRRMSEKRSITAMVSGGLEPVSDGRGKHSFFAQALIDVLDSNDSVLEARKLFEALQVRVIYESGEQGKQNPEYAPIKLAANEGGDFMFVPARVASPARQSSLTTGFDVAMQAERPRLQRPARSQ